jgi:hypothetical protein
MPDHISNRDKIVEALVQELFGPAPSGDELDFSQPLHFSKAEDAYGPWRQKGTGEEVLQRDHPSKRYGVGVLYPAGTHEEEKVDGVAALGLMAHSGETGDTLPEEAREEIEKSLDTIREKLSSFSNDANPGDLDLSLANAYKPSSIGISFLADFPEGSSLVVEVSGGRYRPVQVHIQDSERPRIWWLRSPVSIKATFSAGALCAGSSRAVAPEPPVEAQNTEGLDIRVEVFSRPYGADRRQRLLTVCLVNRTDAAQSSDEAVLFQARFRAGVIAQDGKGQIPAYPSTPHSRLDEEEQSLALLYRNVETFGVGHGCAADWIRAASGRATWVSAECLPTFEAPSTTPDIRREDGTTVEVPMAALAGLVQGDDGFQTLEKIVADYEVWINQKEQEAQALEERHRDAARRHIESCRRCARRMRAGIGYLRSDSQAMQAFQLANHAILLQQLQSRKEPRQAKYEEKSKRIVFSEGYTPPDPSRTSSGRGAWRAFQIAFLLMTVQSAADENDLDRETVELIWFPTGGGKTEAYLGLAAFTLFMRRLRNPEDEGVHVLMRYTLRLLTTQQFQRAARLICAMEHIRKQIGNGLGNKPFRIGMWVGGGNTPNTREQALTVFRGLSKGDQYTQNSFVLDRCPWCSAQMGPLRYKKGRPPQGAPRVLGYSQSGNAVTFKCPDNACPFHSSLPVCVVDEDLYEEPPSMIIGTVDKFAMLAWRPEARALFGIGENGERVASPPGLIIQDELHMISGPLGSMVGLYEAVVEELCTDRRGAQPVRPKIVSSTATIRRYAEQIRAIYGRASAILFPPPGLDQSDSFFGRHATADNGGHAPGRLYVGVHAPGLGSMQTVQVRTFTALLQAPIGLPEAERNPWWTLLLFFNSLRELGTTLSLLQSDIPDYQQVLLNRLARPRRTRRHFWEIKELTGRASSEDIPKAISALETDYPGSDPRPVDVCLASSILEVGVDIDRLSLMAVVGQPKTTSQYIQVTGRVGRSWWVRPGLVVTIYGASKPRDRSHFEKFRSYHERLYAQVEPTSVTPFSPPALDRALHAIMAVYARQTGDADIAGSPYPYPRDMIDQLKRILIPRVRAVDPSELQSFESVFARRADEWRTWQHTKWAASWSDDDIPLLREAGAYTSPENARRSWPTPLSMRSVDAEAIAEIVMPPASPGEPENAQQP